jgi:hypothetical protein
VNRPAGCLVWLLALLVTVLVWFLVLEGVARLAM